MPTDLQKCYSFCITFTHSSLLKSVSKAQPEEEVCDKQIGPKSHFQDLSSLPLVFSIKCNTWYHCAATTDTVTSWFLIVCRLKAKLWMAVPYIPRTPLTWDTTASSLLTSPNHSPDPFSCCASAWNALPSGSHVVFTDVTTQCHLLTGAFTEHLKVPYL